MKRKSVMLEIASTSLGPAIPNSERPHPPHEEIARLAYSYWEARAGRAGSPEEDWYRAEHEIQLRTKTAAFAGDMEK